MNKLQIESITDAFCAMLTIDKDGAAHLIREIPIGRGKTGYVLRIGSFLREEGCFGVMTQFSKTKSLGVPDVPYSNESHSKVIKAVGIHCAQGRHKTWRNEDYPNVQLCQYKSKQIGALLLRLNTYDGSSISSTEGKLLFYEQDASEDPIVLQSGRFRKHEDLLLITKPGDRFGFVCSSGKQFDVNVVRDPESQIDLVTTFIKSIA